MLEEFKVLPENGQLMVQSLYNDFIDSQKEEKDCKTLIGRLTCAICHIYGWHKRGDISRPSAINILRIFVASDSRIDKLLGMAPRKKGDCYKDEIKQILDIDINNDDNNIDIFALMYKENDNDIVITPTVYRNILRTHSEDLYQEVISNISAEHNDRVSDPLYRKLVRYFKPEFIFDVPKNDNVVAAPIQIKTGPSLPSGSPLESISKLRSINAMYDDEKYYASPIRSIDNIEFENRANTIKAHIDFVSSGILNSYIANDIIQRIAEKYDLYTALVNECPSVQKFNVSYNEDDNSFSIYAIDNIKKQNIALVFEKNKEAALVMCEITPFDILQNMRCPEV
jgi:hypothetical protein